MLVCENHRDKAWPEECDCGPGMLSPLEIMRAALTEIAAFDDRLASESLARHGSYSSFDEPGAVQTAREALAKVQRLG